jgi:protein-disulfide isomerase
MPLLEQVLETYPNDVKLIYKSFPLRNHTMAKPAAIAAMAANRQGKFWEFHDEIFLISGGLNNGSFEEIAKKLNLDLEQFNRDRNDPAILQHVDNDTREGAQVGVRGTPTIFVNGKLLTQRSMQGFAAMIGSELAKKGKAEK